MKKVKLSNKAQLEKQIIAELTENQLKDIQERNATGFSFWADSCKGPIKEELNAPSD
ncbi:class I lanthipeptide [Pedobacter sp.]|uniref:class I lanthipeptide n=1 Tax=Pedobacter sp. TaxID=1411316 RepID=UPI0031DD07D3